MDISGIAAVDVFLGLAFLFFLLSTACSAINEAIATSLNWRAKELWNGIWNLLGDATNAKIAADDTSETKTTETPAVDKTSQTAATPRTNTEEFYSHERVQTLFKPQRFLENTRGLHRLPLPKDKKPSYLPPRVFVLTVLDMFASPEAAEVAKAEARAEAARAEAAAAEAGKDKAKAEAARAEAARVEARVDAAMNLPELMARAKLVVDADHLPNKRVKGLLQDALNEAHDGVENRVETFQLALERSFNEAMDRVSGWYKRRTQLMIFVIALVVVGAINADSFVIGQRLFKDDALRASVVAQATKAVDEGTADCVKVTGTASVTQTPVPAPTPSERAANCLEQIHQLGLPLGWSTETSPSGWAIPGKIAGLLVTVFAVLLGAPFWFDVMGKIARLRGAGPAPSTTSPPTPVTVAIAPASAGSTQTTPVTPGDAPTSTGSTPTTPATPGIAGAPRGARRLRGYRR